jgi:RNA polymerase sigma factor (sigma-70 family)
MTSRPLPPSPEPFDRRALLAKLYVEHSAPMWTKAARIIGESEALSVVHAVFEKLLRKEALHPTLFDSGARAYLIAAAKNKAIELLRRRIRGEKLEETAFSSDPEVAGADTIFEAIETREAVSEALNQLPERTREVVVRRGIFGESSKDIAASLGISGPRVSQIYRKGLDILRKILGRRLGDES